MTTSELANVSKERLVAPSALAWIVSHHPTPPVPDPGLARAAARFDAQVLEAEGPATLLCFSAGQDAPPRRAVLLAEALMASPGLGPYSAALHVCPGLARQSDRARALLSALTAQARPGEIVASEAFQRIAHPEWLFEPLPGTLGFRLCAAAPRRALPFVGRTSELAQLRACWQTARKGGPLLVSLQGEAGIGKSRLLAEFLEGLAPEDAIATARCQPDGSTHPYGMLCSLVGGWLSTHPDLFEQLGEAGRDLEYLLGLREAGSSLQPKHLQYRAFSTLNGWLLAQAHRRALVLTLEDLHWSDEASLQWLDSLIAEIAFGGKRAPLMLLGTERTGEVHQRYGGMGIGEVAIALRPLAAGEAMELVAALRPEADAETRSGLCRRGGGNPLYLQAFAQASELAPLAPREVPDNLRWHLARRLDRLSAIERRVLETVAIAGPVAEHDRLAQVLPPLDLKYGLGGLKQAQILEVPARSPSSIGFCHHLLYETAYDAIPPERRQAQHAQHAERLERAGAPLGEVASHLLRSDRPSLARPLLRRAADQARKRHALAEAQQLLEQALMLATEEADAHPLRLSLAEVLSARGELKRACEHLCALQGRLAGESRLQHALLASTAYERQGEYGLATAYLHEGRAALSPVDRRGHASLVLAEAQLALRQGAFERCRKLAQEALAHLSDSPSHDRALAYSLWGIATYRLEGPACALPLYQEALAMRERLGAEAAVAGSLSNLGAAYYELGRWDEALASFEGALSTFERLGERLHESFVLNNSAHLLLNRGELEEAERRYRRALALKRQMNEQPGIAVALSNLGNTLSRRGSHAEARACLEEAIARLERVGEGETLCEVYQIYGMVALEAGDDRRARKLLTRVRDLSRHHRREAPLAIALRGCSTLARREERHDDALALAGESVALNERLGNPLELGRSLVTWGEALAAKGSRAQAQDAFERARALLAPLGALPDLKALEALPG
ncbi:MAG TPA: tetratricopeptide repeat protein [Pantanalinema sp.]